MENSLSIADVIKLRKATRSVAERMTGQLQADLSAMSPLISIRQVLGRHVRGNEKNSARGEDDAFEELQRMYRELAASTTYVIPREIESPIDIRQTAVDVVAADYNYEITSGDHAKPIRITCPLRWILYPAGFSPHELRQVVTNQAQATDQELQSFVLQYLALYVTLSKKLDVLALLADLRFPIEDGRMDGCGKLLVKLATSPIATMRAPDDIVLQSTELTGSATFEEVIDLQSVAQMRDPLQVEILELVDQGQNS